MRRNEPMIHGMGDKGMSQRIRLSDATARGEYERTGGQEAASCCAINEARSILAAEENPGPAHGTDRGRVVYRDTAQHPPWQLFGTVSGDILADSLSALCDATDAGDYLAALQGSPNQRLARVIFGG
jgi:hypothetical protein